MAKNVEIVIGKSGKRVLKLLDNDVVFFSEFIELVLHDTTFETFNEIVEKMGFCS